MEKLPQRENWPSLVWEICPCGKIYTLHSQGRVLRENYPCGKFTQNPWVNFPIPIMGKVPQWENLPSLVYAKFAPVGNLPKLIDPRRVLRENYSCGKTYPSTLGRFSQAIIGKLPQWENLPSLVYAKFAPVGNLPTGANSPKYIDPGWVLREIYPCGKTYRSSLALFSHS
jgi:hypothetical protein